jgi:hypothetical protein
VISSKICSAGTPFKASGKSPLKIVSGEMFTAM